VREDYSAGGDARDYFPHDHARSRAYRWGEDGIAGISDEHPSPGSCWWQRGDLLPPCRVHLGASS
jgi:hypothetical protein